VSAATKEPGAKDQTGLRADAVRNRRALVRAAWTAFGSRGLDAPLDEIARRAGVGNATLYRHFPTRCMLIAAVYAETMTEIVGAVQRALADPDPWSGFAGHVRFLFELQAHNRGLADLFTTRISVAPELERLRSRLQRDTAAVARRAQESGDLRADFEPEDLALLLMANAGLIRRTAATAPTAWRRLLAYTLDGLHATAVREVTPRSDGMLAVRAVMDHQGQRLLGAVDGRRTDVTEPAGSGSRTP